MKLLAGLVLKYVNLQNRFCINPKRLCSTLMEQKINVKGININYVKNGSTEGDHAILCMPGLLGSAWTDFKPQIEGLTKLLPNYSVIAWDPPGYGASRPPSREFGLKFFHNDSEIAHQMMISLGFNKYSILGWSDGGIAGIIMAGKYSKAVENLIIWGANSYVTPEDLKVYESIRDVKNWSKRMREPLEKLYGADYFQNTMTSLVESLNEMYAKQEGNICREFLSNITCPTFILHGAKDPMIAPEHVPYLMKNIKGAKLYVFEDGKHNIHLKYADQFNNTVTNFLERKL